MTWQLRLGLDLMQASVHHNDWVLKFLITVYRSAFGKNSLHSMRSTYQRPEGRGRTKIRIFERSTRLIPSTPPCARESRRSTRATPRYPPSPTIHREQTQKLIRNRSSLQSLDWQASSPCQKQFTQMEIMPQRGAQGPVHPRTW